MIKEQEELFKKYPTLFNLEEMIGGICTGPGWFWLIDRLCAQLQFDIDNNGYPKLEVIQVKEKFGGLRFYTSSLNEKQQAMINFACSLSFHVCEECGSLEDVKSTGSGWVRSLCPECMNKH